MPTTAFIVILLLVAISSVAAQVFLKRVSDGRWVAFLTFFHLRDILAGLMQKYSC